MIYNLPQVKQAKQETWVLNYNDDGPGGNVSLPWNEPWEYSISFVSNGQSFNKIANVVEWLTPQLYYDDLQIAVGSRRGSELISSTWIDLSYRIITFLESPTGDLLAWLQANAVKQ